LSSRYEWGTLSGEGGVPVHRIPALLIALGWLELVAGAVLALTLVSPAFAVAGVLGFALLLGLAYGLRLLEDIRHGVIARTSYERAQGESGRTPTAWAAVTENRR